MRYTIRQLGSQWEVLDQAGARVGSPHPTYDAALAVIATRLAEMQDGMQPSGDGLLPERWVSDPAIAFSQDTGDGRDFTNCQWTSRDPASSLMPLMLQTETEVGHYGAELAGFFEECNCSGNANPTAAGRFYDTEVGQQARDLLLDGRRFGVSVDPGAVELEWVCTEEDEDGYCIGEQMQFLSYEVIGLTMTPFPAFAEAAIVLDGSSAASAAPARRTGARVHTPANARPRVAAGAPVQPPAEWFTMPEPDADSPLMVPQYNEATGAFDLLACPLRIEDDGRVYGHLAYWGQCLRGNLYQCDAPEPSPSAYREFMVGETLCADGTRVASGRLTVGCDHAPLRGTTAAAARDHYAHAGLGWADVRVMDGTYGPWVCGALLPDVNELQLRVLRGLQLSGDWRSPAGRLDLVAVLAVNNPGYPIARDALVASALAVPTPHGPRLSVEAGVVQAMVASGRVRACPECAERGQATRRVRDGQLAEALRRIEMLEAAVKPLRPLALQALREDVHAGNGAG